MRGKGDVGFGPGGGDDVTGAVDEGVPSKCAELIEKPGGALLFHEGRRGDAATLKVDLVDPGLFASEELERVLDAWEGGEFVEIDPRGGVDAHA